MERKRISQVRKNYPGAEGESREENKVKAIQQWVAMGKTTQAKKWSNENVKCVRRVCLFPSLHPHWCREKATAIPEYAKSLPPPEAPISTALWRKTARLLWNARKQRENL